MRADAARAPDRSQASIGSKGRRRLRSSAGFAPRSSVQGAGDVQVIDNGAGDGLNSTAGAILIAGTFFGYEVVVNTSQSKPAVGSASQPQMDIGFTLTNITGTAGSIWLYASDTDFDGVVSLAGSLDGNASYGTFTMNGGVWVGARTTLVPSATNSFRLGLSRAARTRPLARRGRLAL